jgi:hypothetical protein
MRGVMFVQINGLSKKRRPMESDCRELVEEIRRGFQIWIRCFA